jgi:hypothetical protein
LHHLVDTIDVHARLAEADGHFVNSLHVAPAQAVKEVVDLLGGHDIHVVRLELQIHAFALVIIEVLRLFKLGCVHDSPVGDEDELVLPSVILLEIFDRVRQLLFFALLLFILEYCFILCCCNPTLECLNLWTIPFLSCELDVLEVWHGLVLVFNVRWDLHFDGTLPKD